MSPSIATIQRAVCRDFGIGMDDLLKRDHHREVVRPRQIAMYLARKHTGKSGPVIAKMFDRDHATMISSVRLVAELRAREPKTAEIIGRVERDLGVAA